MNGWMSPKSVTPLQFRSPPGLCAIRPAAVRAELPVFSASYWVLYLMLYRQAGTTRDRMRLLRKPVLLVAVIEPGEQAADHFGDDLKLPPQSGVVLRADQRAPPGQFQERHAFLPGGPGPS